MKTYVDKKILNKLSHLKDNEAKNIFFELSIKANLLAAHESLEISLDWPSLFEYLELGSLFDNFPAFDEKNPLFTAIITALNENAEKELLMRMYDQIFVECLTHVKAMPEIHPTFLIGQIRKKRESSFTSEKLFSSSLDYYEQILGEHPYAMVHGLILYLAWDRACVHLAILFEYVFSNPKALDGLLVFRECLMESFQHIKEQGKTTPSFFRLIEALYAYEMREENLQKHSESEWLILCQSSISLKSRDLLSDIYYIDANLISLRQLNDTEHELPLLKMLTMESPEKIRASLTLANYFMDKLKQEIGGWEYALGSMQIACFKDEQEVTLLDVIS